MSQAYQALRRQAGQSQAETQPQRRDLSFPALLERSKNEIARALPRHLNPDRMGRIALTAFRTNPKLGECNPMSVLAAVVQASQMGLEIGMMGEAFLVPFKTECQLIPGYAGLMKLARQSGQVADIYAHEVRENDSFILRLGLARELDHQPLQGKGGFPASTQERGEITGFYAVCVFKDGNNTFVALSTEDVNRIRDRSNGYKSAKRYGKESPWDTDYPEMGKKTAIRALAKFIPKSPELAAALAMDSAADAGASQGISLQKAADGTYEPIFQLDPETGEILPDDDGNTPPQAWQRPSTGRQQTAQAPTSPASAPAPAAASAPASPSPSDEKQKTEPKGKAPAIAPYLAQMEQVSSQDDLNEVYIRAETAIQKPGDREAIDKAYNEALERIKSGRLL